MSALFTLAKLGVDLVVSAGVGSVVGNAIKTSTPADLKLVKKISIAVGGLVLSNLVADQATKYVSEQIDTLAEQTKNATNLVKRFRTK